MTQNPPRPRIALLTTGGTIAMTAQGGRGGQLALDGAALSASVPGIETLAEIEVRPVLAKPSASFT